MTLERDITVLAGRGLGEADIARWLGIPRERVRDVLARRQHDDHDQVLVESFPASDPPSWPER
jgi:hypothetical protein